MCCMALVLAHGSRLLYPGIGVFGHQSKCTVVQCHQSKGIVVLGVHMGEGHRHWDMSSFQASKQQEAAASKHARNGQKSQLRCGASDFAEIFGEWYLRVWGTITQSNMSYPCT